MGCWRQELQRKMLLRKLDHLCRQLEIWDGGLCRPETRKIFHVAVDYVWPRRGKTAIFWTNIYEIVFLTASATASVTPGTRNPRISTQTVRNHLAENNLHACRPYVGTVLTDRHRRERPQWADRHITGQGKIGGRFFFQMNPGLHCPIVMVGSGSTDVGMNVTLTVAFFSGISFGCGGSVMVLGQNKLWVSYPISGHWWQFERKSLETVSLSHTLFLSYKITALFLCFSKTTPDLTLPVTIFSSCETTILIS